MLKLNTFRHLMNGTIKNIWMGVRQISQFVQFHVQLMLRASFNQIKLWVFTSFPRPWTSYTFPKRIKHDVFNLIVTSYHTSLICSTVTFNIETEKYCSFFCQFFSKHSWDVTLVYLFVKIKELKEIPWKSIM